MDSNVLKLGGFLNVPSVQELAKQKLELVPPRYVRSDLDHAIISTSASSQEIPVIDFRRLLSGDDLGHGANKELEKLHSACREWGFFQLVNHGVSSSIVEKVKFEVQEFFNLPLEEKEKFGQEPGDTQGYGQASVVSEEQKLDWGDKFSLILFPSYLRKSHLFLKLRISFREALEAYSTELQNLAMQILNKMAKALGMKIEEMDALFEEGFQFIRMNYYPPCPKPELVMGLSPHSDAVGLTILLPVSEIEGLQVKKDGHWIPVMPIPNAFIVNIGDILEIVSNGIYRSVEHRATVNSDRERLSVATFFSPKLDGVIGPAPSLVAPELPAKFKTIGVADHFKQLFSRKLDGRSYIDAMRI